MEHLTTCSFRIICFNHFCFLFTYFKEALPIKAFNDSGCLLGDSDLFDAQLEEDSDPQLEGEEEESLDAIRAAVKKKAKHKVSTDFCFHCLV